MSDSQEQNPTPYLEQLGTDAKPKRARTPRPVEEKRTGINYRFNEGAILDEVRAYVDGTYGAHYSAEDGAQALDGIIGSGNGEGFTVGNVQKYAFRYGKKNGYNRDDLLKVVHYAIFALHLNDRYAAQRQQKKNK